MDVNKLCIYCLRESDVSAGSVCPHCGHIVGSQPDLNHQLKPMTILRGKYLIGDVLGEGGFGITYIGIDLNLEIRIAIKEFYPNGFATRESASTSTLTIYSGQHEQVVYKWRDNFMKEARSLAKCAHLPGVVGVRDFFEENNTAYLVMEYIEGVTLKNHAQTKNGKIPASELLPSIEPVFTALGEVHKQGLIHRDISPDNIMLLSGGKMKLLDFGAAREYAADEKSLSVMLKPGYAPEEQYRSKGNQGPWSDIYALAGTIYKCLTGITPPEAMERMRQDELRSPNSVGAGLTAGQEQALMKALAVRAEDRYQTMEEFRRDLYVDRNVSHSVQSAQSTYAGSLNVGARSEPITRDEANEEPKQNRDSADLNHRKHTNTIAGGVLIAVCLILLFVLYTATRNTQSEQTADSNAVSPQFIDEAEETAEPVVEEQPEEVVIPDEYRPAYENIMNRFGIDEVAAMTGFSVQNDDFFTTADTTADYYKDMEYRFYGSGIADFTFHYPTNLYNTVIFGDGWDAEYTENYGTLLEYIDFWGSDNSELLYCATKRNDTMSLEDMTNYVYLMESRLMVDASKLIMTVTDDNDHGRVIVTGYNSDRSLLIYDLFKIEHEYVFQMKVIFPRYTDDYDKMAKDYFTECVYRLCGFSGSTKEVRSFAEYMEAASQ